MLHQFALVIRDTSGASDDNDLGLLAPDGTWTDLGNDGSNESIQVARSGTCRSDAPRVLRQARRLPPSRARHFFSASALSASYCLHNDDQAQRLRA